MVDRNSPAYKADRVAGRLILIGLGYILGKRWIVRVYIIEDLYQYAYPIILSKSFRNYNNQTDCLLKLRLIKAISVKSTKKIFHLSEFIQQLKLLGNQNSF